MQDYTAILQSRGLHTRQTAQSETIEGKSHTETSREELESQADDILREVAIQAPALPPNLPRGIRLVIYVPKKPPVAIEQCSVVTNVELFIRTTLADLDARLNNPAGGQWGWTIREMLDRLRQVGLVLEVEKI